MRRLKHVKDHVGFMPYNSAKLNIDRSISLKECPDANEDNSYQISASA